MFLQRLIYSFIAFFVVLLTGTLGYKFIGGDNWSIIDALYMTVITLTTVGYGETHPFTDDSLRIFTIFLIFAGLGVVTYTFSSITAYLVEGELKDTIRRKKMLKEIQNKKDHIIVCGAGLTATHIIEELIKTRNEFVVVDSEEERIKRMIRDLGEFPYVVGDPTEDEFLITAGIKSAKGIIPVLTDDKDNLFVTITARALNSNIRIVARVLDLKSRPKLMNAGANVVTSPQYIGGLRMANEMIRPSVTIFLDHMVREEKKVVRFDEISITEKSGFCGKAIRDCEIRSKTGANLLAIRTEHKFNHNPDQDVIINKGDILIVYGDSNQIQKLKDM